MSAPWTRPGSSSTAQTARNVKPLTLEGQRGLSLVEVLIGLVIVLVASIASLSYFAYGLGGIGKSGNRRAALERARQRLEQLLAASPTAITPPKNGNPYWLTCNGDPCAWSAPSAAPVAQEVPVGDLGPQPTETVVQWVDDPSVQTADLDTLELGVKVWFIPGSTDEDDFHRVYIRTLRTP